MKKQLKFGVEIEFFGVTRAKVTEALRQAGVNAQTEGYNHVTKNYWKVITDSSVNGQGCEGGRGSEIVSPVLYGEEGIAELKLVCKVLDEVGAKVDKSCGVHVHHDINGFNLEQVKNIYRLYYKFKQSIEMLFPKSRRDGQNRYCKGLNLDYVSQIASASSIQQIQIIAFDRYYTVNFASYVKYGTVEFRQHAGSTDADKIANWVMITHRLLEKAKVNRAVELVEDANWRVADSNWHFRKALGGGELEVYAVDRMAYWRGKERAKAVTA